MRNLREMVLIKYFTHHIDQAIREESQIWISGRFIFEKLSETIDKEGRYVRIKGRLGELVTILNMYPPPPGSDWSFYRKMFDLMIQDVGGNAEKTERVTSMCFGIVPTVHGALLAGFKEWYGQGTGGEYFTHI